MGQVCKARYGGSVDGVDEEMAEVRRRFEGHARLYEKRREWWCRRVDGCWGG
jgi:hypothetical protein